MASSGGVVLLRRDVEDLKPVSSAFITNVEHLASYNWIEAPKSTPTIAVPGVPPFWSPPSQVRRLKKDTGVFFIAQNAARHPEYPMEPLFRALYLTKPSFDIDSVDIITDRNNIRQLVAFIDPSTYQGTQEAFTIGIEVHNDTAVLCRQNAETTRVIGRDQFRGYGHEFEKTYTKRQISGSTGHHRIISYNMGGLKFLVRHECDGAIRPDASEPAPTEGIQSQEDLSNILPGLSLTSTKNQSAITHEGSKLIVKEEGYPTEIGLTLEIKTRTSKRDITTDEVAVQLWASQTPNLVRAYHENGEFRKPEVEDVGADIKIWEQGKQGQLCKLPALLRRIVVLVKELGGRATLSYDPKRDELVIAKNGLLPKDLYGKWNSPMVQPSAPTVPITEAANDDSTELDKIIAGIKSIRMDFDWEGDLIETGDRESAQRSANELEEFLLRDLTEERHKVFNVLMHVVSHPKTFPFRIREDLYDVFVYRYSATDKERAKLRDWMNKAEDTERGDDDTTENYISDDDLVEDGLVSNLIRRGGTNAVFRDLDADDMGEEAGEDWDYDFDEYEEPGRVFVGLGEQESQE